MPSTQAAGQFRPTVLDLRERLGAIPLLIDDVTRDKFTSHVPGLSGVIVAPWSACSCVG